MLEPAVSLSHVLTRLSRLRLLMSFTPCFARKSALACERRNKDAGTSAAGQATRLGQAWSERLSSHASGCASAREQTARGPQIQGANAPSDPSQQAVQAGGLARAAGAVCPSHLLNCGHSVHVVDEHLEAPRRSSGEGSRSARHSRGAGSAGCRAGGAGQASEGHFAAVQRVRLCQPACDRPWPRGDHGEKTCDAWLCIGGAPWQLPRGLPRARLPSVAGALLRSEPASPKFARCPVGSPPVSQRPDAFKLRRENPWRPVN